MHTYLGVLVGLTMQFAAQAQPPQILQIHREALRAGGEAAYGEIEEEITRLCHELMCPHPYLGMEALTGPKEVWFFNAYGSSAEQKKVADDYAKNRPLLAALNEASKRKAAFTTAPINVYANYRRDLSRGEPWRVGHGRFLVITLTKSARPIEGTVFEAPDTTRFILMPARSRDGAEAIAAAAGPEARIFAVRPAWSTPAREWIDADPSFWLLHPAATRD